MQIKKGSVLDQFYNFPTRHYGSTTDICTFVRGALGGVLLAMLFTALICAITIVALEPWVILIMYLITGTVSGFIGSDPSLGILSAGVQLLSITYIIVVKIWQAAAKAMTWRYERKPSVIAARYKAFKEKTCILVERV